MFYGILFVNERKIKFEKGTSLYFYFCACLNTNVQINFLHLLLKNDAMYSVSQNDSHMNIPMNIFNRLIWFKTTSEIGVSKILQPKLNKPKNNVSIAELEAIE